MATLQSLIGVLRRLFLSPRASDLTRCVILPTAYTLVGPSESFEQDARPERGRKSLPASHKLATLRYARG
jgi:hypothetical protein